MTSHTARMQEKFARYCELRAAGSLPADAGRDIEVGAGTWQKYERAWREKQGLDRRTPGAHFWRNAS